MTKLPSEQFVKCDNCGHDRSEHYAANLSDGNLIGQYFLVCPTTVFRAKGYNQFGEPWKPQARPEVTE